MGLWHSAEGRTKCSQREVGSAGDTARKTEQQVWACGTVPNEKIKYLFVRGSTSP